LRQGKTGRANLREFLAKLVRLNRAIYVTASRQLSGLRASKMQDQVLAGTREFTQFRLTRFSDAFFRTRFSDAFFQTRFSKPEKMGWPDAYCVGGVI
jgi:hypothetical protein